MGQKHLLMGCCRRRSAGPALSVTQQAIIDLIKNSPLDWKTREIAERLGISKPTVSESAARLVDMGLIVKSGHGLWRAAGRVELDLEIDPEWGKPPTAKTQA
jgi:predicted transcriptional regulator